jgi:hypothetical protein
MILQALVPVEMRMRMARDMSKESNRNRWILESISRLVELTGFIYRHKSLLNGFA